MSRRFAARSLPESWRLRAEPGPALRRGALVAVPPAAAILLELVHGDDAIAGGLATAALFGGFLAFDAPAIIRARWQVLIAPLIGLSGVIGVYSSTSTALAVLALGVVGGIAAYGVAVSPRVLIAGLTCALGVLIAQGFYLEPDEALTVFYVAVAGVLAQALWSLLAFLTFDRGNEPQPLRELVRGGRAALRANLTIRSPPMRHAIRFGAALALGVAIYRLTGFDDHGYWIPLTILFVLRPSRGETFERIPMRAAGTIVGLVIATALAEVLGNDPVTTAVILGAATAVAYALLAIEYAVFTTAITVFVVLLTDTLGTPALEAAGERAVGTVIGIAIAGLAFVVYGEWAEPGARLPERET